MTERATRIAHGRPHLLYGVEREDYVRRRRPYDAAAAAGRLRRRRQRGRRRRRREDSPALIDEIPLATPPMRPSRETIRVRTGSSRTARPM